MPPEPETRATGARTTLPLGAIPGTAPRPGSPFGDGPPTRLRRDESSVATIRQLIDTVAIPRLSLVG